MSEAVIGNFKPGIFICGKYTYNYQMTEKRRIYFYPHKKFRDRQIDTAKYWKNTNDTLLNREEILSREGGQVLKKEALSGSISRSWKQVIPLINIKNRPKCSPDDIVYIWGGLISHGPHIVEIDTPFALTGFNVRSFFFYKKLISFLLRRKSCLEIRCISKACQQSLRKLLGEEVYRKSSVVYPHIIKNTTEEVSVETDVVKFLFVGTQFLIKGGLPLVEAFTEAYKINSQIHLTLITHMPGDCLSLTNHPAIDVYEPKFTRGEIGKKFMSVSDVFIHPTYVDSFGMVLLEALSYGLAFISSNNYAIPEIVVDNKNGIVLNPEYSHWEDFCPTSFQFDWHNTVKHIRELETSGYTLQIKNAILTVAEDPKKLKQFKEKSIQHLEDHFLK